jgi:hypothetical protein
VTDQELNALVAQTVMSWTLTKYRDDEYVAASTPADFEDAAANDGWGWEGDPGFDGEAWQFTPSTDISCAWMVVEKMRESCSFLEHNGFVLTLQETVDQSDKWYCEFSQPEWAEAEAETAAKAICLAALKAKGALGGTK